MKLLLFTILIVLVKGSRSTRPVNIFDVFEMSPLLYNDQLIVVPFLTDDQDVDTDDFESSLISFQLTSINQKFSYSVKKNDNDEKGIDWKPTVPRPGLASTAYDYLKGPFRQPAGKPYERWNVFLRLNHAIYRFSQFPEFMAYRSFNPDKSNVYDGRDWWSFHADSIRIIIQDHYNYLILEYYNSTGKLIPEYLYFIH